MAKAFIAQPIGTDASFGAIRAIYPVRDALCYVNGAQGCTFYPRVFFGWSEHTIVRALTSGMESQQVIFGGEQELQEGLEQAVEVFHPKLIVVQNTCIPALTGDDTEGIARIVSQKTGVKIISTTNPNYKGTMVDGYKNVVDAYIAEVMEKPQQIRKKTVNLLGVVPGEYNWTNDVRELTRILNAIGLTVNCALVGEEVTVQEIKEAPMAEANVLLFPEVGLDHARFMEKRFGTPWVPTQYAPVGIESTRDWILRIAEFFDVKDQAEAFMEKDMAVMGKALLKLNTIQIVSPLQFLARKKYAIEGQPFIIPAMIKFLYEDLNMRPCLIALHAPDKACLAKVEGFLESHGLSAEIQTSGDHLEFKEAVKRNYTFPDGDPFVAYGTYYLANDMAFEGIRVPVIRFSYPVVDEVIVTDRPFVGFRGVVTHVETLLNVATKTLIGTKDVCGFIPNPFDIWSKLLRFQEGNPASQGHG